MFDAIVLWVHIVAAVLFIGPQAFLIFAAMPAMRTIADVEARARATSVVTSRFGMLGGGALVLLLVTGIWNYYEVESRGLIDIDAFPRYYFTLFTKLSLVSLVVVLTALHAGVFGRKLQRLQQSGAPESEIAAVRRWSILSSTATFAASIGILLCAALMSSTWSKVG